MKEAASCPTAEVLQKTVSAPVSYARRAIGSTLRRSVPLDERTESALPEYDARSGQGMHPRHSHRYTDPTT